MINSLLILNLYVKWRQRD